MSNAPPKATLPPVRLSQKVYKDGVRLVVDGKPCGPMMTVLDMNAVEEWLRKGGYHGLKESDHE